MERREILLVLESESDGLDFLRGALREIGDGAMLDLALFAIRLAQEDAVVGFAANAGDGAIEIQGMSTYTRSIINK